MRLTAQQPTTASTTDNPLVPVVRLFSANGRQALYAASNSGALRRATWDGCALNRAGKLVGEAVSNRRHAAKAFDTTNHVVSRFISVWDRLEGSDQECTTLLRDAILAVGLYSDADRDDPDMRRRLSTFAREYMRA